MAKDMFTNLCVGHFLEDVRKGLSSFSGLSRTALVFALKPESPVRVLDPQGLLAGHEPKFGHLYLESDTWRSCASKALARENFEATACEPPQLAGLVCHGASTRSMFHQMWFTEHHPDMCSVGPTRCWLEYAANLLSQDLSTRNVARLTASGYVLQEYATHAVRDYIVDLRNMMLGPDTQLRVYPILDAVLAVSKTREEGSWARGAIAFVEPAKTDRLNFLARFPPYECPELTNVKHVRKLLQATENSSRMLLSDGRCILGIVSGRLPEWSIQAEFMGGHGFIRTGESLVCSFADGRFHSSTRRAKLVQVEEILLETDMDPEQRHALFGIISQLVHHAGDGRFGCTLVVDFSRQPEPLSGQQLEEPLDLTDAEMLALARSLSRVDGALHIGADLRLHGFACLLDGASVAGENRARGARFNSALRFTATREEIMVVVVSSDRPVSIIQGGVELTAQCSWSAVSECAPNPPTLAEWVGS